MGDVPSFKVPDQYLTGAQNVVFRNGIPERIKGNRDAYATVADDVLNMINTVVGTTNYWVYHGTDQSYVASSSGHTNITLLAGLTAVAAAHEWSSCTINGIVCANNQNEAPMYWDGVPANRMQALTGWIAGATCNVLLAHRYHLFALGLTEGGSSYPMRVRHSDAAQPGSIPNTWTAAAGNEAGSFELSDEDDSPIITGATLGDSLLVYKSNSVHTIDYVQGQNVYEPRPLFSEFGALTRRGVAQTPRGHFVVGDGEMFITDGTDFKPVGLLKARRLLFDALDQDNYEMVFAVYNKPRDEIWVCYPTAGNSLCNKALVFDRNFNEYGTRDLDDVSCAAVGIVNDTAPSQVIDDQTAIIDTVTSAIDATNYSLAARSLLLGKPNGPAFELVDQDAVVSLNAKIERHDLTFGEPERVKLVRRIHVEAEDYGSLLVKVGSRMAPKDPITWSDEVTLTNPSAVVDTFAQGRYISLEARSTDGNAWRLPRFGFETEMRGYN